MLLTQSCRSLNVQFYIKRLPPMWNKTHKGHFSPGDGRHLIKMTALLCLWCKWGRVASRVVKLHPSWRRFLWGARSLLRWQAVPRRFEIINQWQDKPAAKAERKNKMEIIQTKVKFCQCRYRVYGKLLTWEASRFTLSKCCGRLYPNLLWQGGGGWSTESRWGCRFWDGLSIGR